MEKYLQKDYVFLPTQYLALMQGNLQTWLLQSCKVLLLDFLNMTTYIGSPSHKVMICVNHV